MKLTELLHRLFRSRTDVTPTEERDEVERRLARQAARLRSLDIQAAVKRK